MTYRILETEELKIQGAKKLFIKNVEYRFDTYIMAYDYKFQDFSLPIDSEELVFNFGNSVESIDKMVLLEKIEIIEE